MKSTFFRHSVIASNRQCNHFPVLRRCERWITTAREARMLLGILPSDVLQPATLRKAYFVAAKECHPDTSNSVSDDEGHERFLKVTEAYELLVVQLKKNTSQHHADVTSQHQADVSTDSIVIVSQNEEESFRRQCQEILGLSAEIVEECKTNHGFRQWLSGNTDAAHLWRDFLMRHGGLAPILQPLPELGAGTMSTQQPRRRRKR